MEMALAIKLAPRTKVTTANMQNNLFTIQPSAGFSVVSVYILTSLPKTFSAQQVFGGKNTNLSRQATIIP